MTTSDHQAKFLVSKVAAGGFDARKKLISSLRSPHHCLDSCEVVGHCKLLVPILLHQSPITTIGFQQYQN